MKKKKVKLVQVFGSGNYPFNGWNDVIISVTKETKDRIEGYETNLRGNSRLKRPDRSVRVLEEYEKIVVNKSKVQGWKYLE